MSFFYKFLARRFRQNRAEKAGLPYEDDDEADRRLLFEKELPDGTRLADPTPEEINFSQRNGLANGVDWRNWRKYFTHEHYTLKKITSLFVTLTVITLLILLVVYEDPIIKWLAPIGEKWKRLPAGWLIPIAILIVMSFPPIVGQEVMQILCGVVFGIGPGFGIVAAGTVVGEVLEFYVFRLLCGSRVDKFEKKSLAWGLLARITRDGGFTMVLMCRLSVLPAHYTTVVFALVGTNFFKYLAAVILSLVEPLSNVYLGVLAAEAAVGKSPSGSGVASGFTIAATVVITVAAKIYIDRKANKAKPDFITQRRMERMGSSAASQSRPSTPFSMPSDPEASATNLSAPDADAFAGHTYTTPYDPPTLTSHSHAYASVDARG